MSTDTTHPHLRRRPRWADLGALLAAYGVLTAVWVLIGELILSNSAVTDADTSVSKWFEARRTPRLDELTMIGSNLGDTITKIAVTALVMIVVTVAWRRWKEPLMVAAPLVLEASVFITVTWIVGRPRPAVQHLESSPVDSSFPSGHVAAAAVYSAMVIVLFWHTRRRLLRWVSVAVVGVVVVVVGLSRLYRGMHHLTDVLAGVALGLTSVAVCWWWLQRTFAPVLPADDVASTDLHTAEVVPAAGAAVHG